MDLIPPAQGSSPRFVKRSAHMSEQSRYDAVGYPKSTRVPRKQQSLATLRSVPTQQKQQQQEPRLMGFEMRVISTHSGKAVVHAPILADSPLPPVVVAPPSAAELRYNAQRALISTTAVLRNATSGGASAAAKTEGHATIGVRVGGSNSGGGGGGGRRARRVTRTMSDRMSPTSSEGFHISMQFASEDERPVAAKGLEQGRVS
ncbi:hypothetical protein GGI21_005376, partial [Coemansia aciculifera]